ncbi:pathogenesis-related protein PR-1-like [Cornus florida]|uniref:pathogenesis-related protein PR-1-like n=1 Tax=Cornus florida TaxID=4283 RepID=UPI00289C5857|nr:pathogenesis-related protein PR-1-like [Cornus florida]
MPIWSARVFATLIISTSLHFLLVSADVHRHQNPGPKHPRGGSNAKPEPNPPPIQSNHKLSPEAQQYLTAHNLVRQQMHVLPLQWDENLANFAHGWAVQRINDCKPHHHSGSQYGENTLWAQHDELSPDGVVKIWSDEKKNYDHSRVVCTCPPKHPKCMCGHYTQIVWATTRRVGCGNVTCNNDKGILVVCSYDPPGNFVNLNPLIGNPSDATHNESCSPPPSPLQPTTAPLNSSLPSTSVPHTHQSHSSSPIRKHLAPKEPDPHNTHITRNHHVGHARPGHAR